MSDRIRKENIIKMEFPRLCQIFNNRGPCCLAVLPAVAKYFGKQFKPEQFEYLFKLADISPGLNDKKFEYYFQPLHIDVEIKADCDIDDIRAAVRAGIPCAVVFQPHENSHGGMCMHRGDHLALVVGISKNNIYLADNMFCNGQLVDWRPLKRFKEKWFDTNDCGFPDYINLMKKKVYGKLILFRGEKKAKNFDNIWITTPKLKKKYQKELSGGWKKGELARVRKNYDEMIRRCEESDRETYEMGDLVAPLERVRKNQLESVEVDQRPSTSEKLIEGIEFNYDPEEEAKWLIKTRAIEAITPREQYKCYVEGRPLPIPDYD